MWPSRVADATPFRRTVSNPALKGRPTLIRRYAAAKRFTTQRSSHWTLEAKPLQRLIAHRHGQAMFKEVRFLRESET